MSLNPVRTIRSNGFRISSLALALAATAGLGACDVQPEGEDGVQAISSGLIAVMENGTAADNASGPVEMVFSIGRPFDPTSQSLNVTFSTLDFGSHPATAGTACTAGIDYIAVPGRPLTFPAGVTTITTSVTVCNDALAEGTETFATHVVETASAHCDGDRCAAIGSITDGAAAPAPPPPPAPPSLRINDVTVIECLKGSCLANFTVTLSAPSAADVSFQALTVNDSAVSTVTGCLYPFLHGDFVPVNRQVTIPAGSTTTRISVQICGDNTPEPVERFFMTLSNPVNATIADGRGVATIND